MKYELTIFKSPFDNKTHRKMSLSSWDEFVNLLSKLYEQKGEKGGRNSSPLISPAVFKTDTTRSNDNTLHWGGWCAVDVDDHNFTHDVGELKKEIHKMFSEFDYVVYNTASSRSDYLKFRIVFRTDQVIDNTRIKHFWYALNTEIGEIGDPQTKDLSRMYYVPAQYPNACSFFFSNSGRALDVDSLVRKHPFAQKQGLTFLDRLPPDMQRAVINHRKESLENTNYSWTSYRNCPFLHKRLALEYKAITGTGWYNKSYSIMVNIATNAIRKGYPITATQIATMCREMDSENPETKNRYKKRNYEKEADGALEYAYRRC
jgi:hypothetical protein